MARIQLSGTQIPTLSKLNVDGELTLDAASGTTGQVLISQGTGNTPSWTSSLTALTGLSSAAGVALPISTSTVSTGNSGDISVTTGTVTGSPGTTGAVTIASGDSASSGANSGAVVIKTGAGSGSTGNSGSVTIDVGVKSGFGTLGAINIGTTNAGVITVGSFSSTSLLLGASASSPTSARNISIAGATGTTSTGSFQTTLNLNNWYAISAGGTASVNLGGGFSLGTGGTSTISIGSWNNNSGTQTIGIGTGNGTSTTTLNGTTTLTGALTLATGTASLAPLKLAAGTNLTTPVYGAVEAVTDAVYITDNPGSTSTGPGRGVVLPKQMVFSQANASAGPSTSSVTVSAFAAANDVLSVLEPAKLYRFRAKYFISTSFSSGIYTMALLHTFSNAPASIKYSFKTYPQTVGTTMKAMGVVSAVTFDPLNGTQSASGTWVVEVDGYFTSHATLTSTLTPQVQINPSAGGNNGATVQAGSWFEIEKLGTSTQTLIAGNWA